MDGLFKLDAKEVKTLMLKNKEFFNAVDEEEIYEEA
jgi:hypothetical protein